MPCSPRTARLLLRDGKAKIVDRKPFTIQLLFGCSGYIQDTSLGVDLGAKHVGIAVTSQDKVLVKGTVELRDDIKSLLETRKVYRRSRRSRNTRYRQARFENRRRTDSWLPPSIRTRVEHTFTWTDKFLGLLPNPTLHIEVGKFDVQKMMNPEIAGIEYQQGSAYGYHDTRYFVFARDKYTCQVCKKSKDKILCTHHIVYKSHGGSDAASNLITVCTDCHTSINHKEGGIFWRWMTERKRVPQYRETVFMNVIRTKVFSKYPEARIVYGSETTVRRKALGLDKTHYNDAIAIAGIEDVRNNSASVFVIRQFRKKKRSLHEATARPGRGQKNVESKRNQKNTKCSGPWSLNDKVEYAGKVGGVKYFV